MKDIKRPHLRLIILVGLTVALGVVPEETCGIELHAIAQNNSNGNPPIIGPSVRVSYYRLGESNRWWSQNWEYTNALPMENQLGQTFTPDANFTLGAIAVRTGPPFLSIPPDSGKSFSNLESKNYTIRIFEMDDANDYTPGTEIASFNDVVPANFEDELSDAGWEWVLFEIPQPSGVTFSVGQCYGFLLELNDVCAYCHASITFSREFDDPFSGGRAFHRLDGSYHALNDWEGYQHSMEFLLIDDAMNIIACRGQEGDLDDDCEVTLTDFALLGENWLNSTATAPF